jgi:hypothetical protein
MVQSKERRRAAKHVGCGSSARGDTLAESHVMGKEWSIEVQ